MSGHAPHGDIVPRRRATGATARHLLLLLLLGLCADAATTAAAPTPRERHDLLPRGAASDPGALIRDVTLAPAFISPGVSPGVQDSALVKFTVIYPGPLRWGVYVDSTNGSPVQNASITPCEGCELTYPPNTQVSVGFTGTFPRGDNPLVLGDGSYHVVLIVFAAAFGDTGRSERAALPLTIDRAAPRFVTLPSIANPKSTPYRNGDTIVINAKLDEAGYTVKADFSQLDSDVSAASTQVIDNLDGSYSIRHTLSDGNTKPDGRNLTVPLRFTDRAGNAQVDASLFFCLGNTPPRISTVRYLTGPDTHVFQNGDTIAVEVQLEPQTPALDLMASADPPWGIDSQVNRTGHPVKITPESSNKFQIRYVISPGDSNKASNGTYCLTLVAVGAGCVNLNDKTHVCPTLYNERIHALTLEPYAATTRDSVLEVAGSAPGALNIRFKRDGEELVSPVVVSRTTGRFVARLPLIEGLNMINVSSTDTLLSDGPTTTISVTRVARGFLQLAAQVKPGAQIRFAPSQAATQVRVEMWDLAGNLVATLEDNRRSDLYEFTWNGQNASGELLRTGPLICRIDAKLVDGRHEMTNRAFVFTAR